MKKIALTALLIACCACTSVDKPKSVSGIICGASINTITIVSSNDTLTFSTIDAYKEALDGIAIGDSATIQYNGSNSNKSSAENILTATKVVVTPIPIEGSWVQPIPGMDGVQGIKLNHNGSAASINMATLVYDSWFCASGKLFLGGKSIGNGQTIIINEAWDIDKLTSDSLVISSENGVTIRFSKEK